MRKITEYLDAFEVRLKQLHHSNMVIGGIHALRAHGLITRDTNDLDIILYQPTQWQLDIIRNTTWEGEAVPREDDHQYEEKDDKRRSYKFGDTDSHLVIDFLMDYEGAMPENLLLMEHNGMSYKVQSIEAVVAAKRVYGREKDLKDFLELKANNF